MSVIKNKINSFTHRVIKSMPSRMQLRALTRLGLINGVVDPELKHLHRFMPMERRRVALDIGANNGVTSMVLARVFKTVYSFEPNPALVARWQRVAPENVTCSQLAMSDATGEATLRIPVSGGQATPGWASLETPSVGESFQEVVVQKTTADAFVCANRVASVDFLKIDVEGHELAVLRGATSTIVRDLPWILAEANDGYFELAEFLAQWNYIPIDKSNADQFEIPDFSVQNVLFVSDSHHLSH